MPDVTFTQLPGRRVVVRRFRPQDVAEFVAYRSDAEVARYLERLAMRREGHLRQSTWAKGEWTDDLLYALLRDEWQAGREYLPGSPGGASGGVIRMPLSQALGYKPFHMCLCRLGMPLMAGCGLCDVQLFALMRPRG